VKPIIKTINAPCAQCSKPFDHEVLFRVDGEGYPELKQRVLNYTAFTSPCPACHGQSNVPQDFKYFDSAAGVRYVVYYFPKGSEGQLEDTIAGVACLRDSGTRTHFVHKISDILQTIKLYEAGTPPPENDFPVSEAAMVRSKALSSEADESMKRVMEAMRHQQETGQFPPGFIENIKRGRAIMDEQKRQADAPKKTSFFKRLFGG
jgi:hypothetical protein